MVKAKQTSNLGRERIPQPQIGSFSIRKRKPSGDTFIKFKAASRLWKSRTSNFIPEAKQKDQ
jgi:hypothetical protein